MESAVAGQRRASAPVVCVAVVQCRSSNNDPDGNLRRAMPFIADAAAHGAKLVLLPELLRAGYELSERIWQHAELRTASPTILFITKEAMMHGIYIGTTFLEVEGDHFFNTFVLSDPTGRVVAAARKAHPASFEAALFRGDPTVKTVFTMPPGSGPLAGVRIGVSICADSFTASHAVALVSTPETASDAAPADTVVPLDLLLMPFSAPLPPVSRFYRARDADTFAASLRTVASRRAALLGVPTLMANKVGPWASPVPLPVPGLTRLVSRFGGLSCVVAAGGAVVAQADGTKEGAVVADVALDPGLKVHVGRVRAICAKGGRYTSAMPRNQHLTRVLEYAGALVYEMSVARAEAAARAGGRWRARGLLVGGVVTAAAVSAILGSLAVAARRVLA